MILKPRTLEGSYVRLELISDAHREEMQTALDCDAEAWTLQLVSGMGQHFSRYWDHMVSTPGRTAYAVRERQGGRIAGTSSFLNIDRTNATLEIGSTWLRPEHRGTAVNPETKLLMLEAAFGAGALRVQFRVDCRNGRSQAALLKLGAKKEGIIRRHKITWTGHRRDTALFSIIDEEWPHVREALQARLAQQLTALGRVAQARSRGTLR